MEINDGDLVEMTSEDGVVTITVLERAS